jgi:hypothetical protein
MQKATQFGGALGAEDRSESLLRTSPSATAVRSRSTPASVRRSSLLRRSDCPGATARRPSRCKGRMFRPSVVRSITISAASAWIVIGPSRRSLARIENWVVRRPAGKRNAS